MYDEGEETKLLKRSAGALSNLDCSNCEDDDNAVARQRDEVVTEEYASVLRGRPPVAADPLSWYCSFTVAQSRSGMATAGR